MNNRKIILLITIILLSGIIGCQIIDRQNLKGKLYSGKKILFINSYHDGYDWSDGIIKGAKSESDKAGIELKIFEMDTKRNPSIEHIKKSALKAKKLIEEYKPDVVITSDDNAARYLIMPYYKNSKIPFVFCGVNWDASIYGFPYDNVTGILEVEYINGIIGYMRDHAQGGRIGFISSDLESDRKSAVNYKNQLNIKLKKEVYVKTVAEWKKEFIRIQKDVDMLIISNTVEIKNWNEDEMKKWMQLNTRIPTGTTNEWVMKYSLIGLIKIPEEHGEWAVETAEKILSGILPKNIPIERSKKGRLFINTTMADKLNIKFDQALMSNAVLVK